MANYSFPARYIKLQKTKSTVALMDRDSGRMMGRVTVGGKGDTTQTRRVTKDVDVDKDGDIDYYKGQIMGRSKKVKVRASNSSKGYVRQV